MPSTPVTRSYSRITPKKTDGLGTPKKVRFSSNVPSLPKNGNKRAEEKRYTTEEAINLLNDGSLSDVETSSEEEWVVTKAFNITLSGSPEYEPKSVSTIDDKLARTKKENDIVSPLKLLRKPEYEVNKLPSANKKSESVVSPIVIKRIKDTKKCNGQSQPVNSPSKHCSVGIRKLKNQHITSPAILPSDEIICIDDSDNENESTFLNKRPEVKNDVEMNKKTNNKNRRNKQQRKDLEESVEKITHLKLEDTPKKRPLAVFENITNHLHETNDSSNENKFKTPSKLKSDVPNSPAKRKSPRTPKPKKPFGESDSTSDEQSPTKKKCVSSSKSKISDSDSDYFMLTPVKRRSLRTPKSKRSPIGVRRSNRKALSLAKSKIAKSDSDSDDDRTIAKEIKKLPQKKNMKEDSEMEVEELSSELKRTPRRTTLSLKKATKKDSDMEVTSPELKQTPKQTKVVTDDGADKSPLTNRRTLRTPRPKMSLQKILNDDSDMEVTSPEFKRTPRRSVRAREIGVDSPDLRRQVLTPKSKTAARKKLDLSTPVSYKKVGTGFLSPVVPMKARRNILGTPSTQLEETRALLHTMHIPSSLPCREKEFENVLKFLSRKVEDKVGGCMYISGVPGTGKTATVHAVVRSLQEKANLGQIPKFNFIEINGLRLTEPRQAYRRIWHELSGEKITPDQAMICLEKKFNNKNKMSTVILVDELDFLCNRRQDVIYNILEWSTKSTSALTVITIANTMDLPERTLKGKVTSRMGLTRLVFQPYTFQQLQQIVMNRIGNNASFHVDAVQLVARKVAAVSGDARRALDICRRVTENVTSDTEIIKISHVEKSLSQIFSGARVQAIKNCTLVSKYLLRAMRDELSRTGVEETTVGQIYTQLSSVCAYEGYEMPTVGSVLSLCTSLADSGLILAENGRRDLQRKVSLNVSPDDIFYALNC